MPSTNKLPAARKTGLLKSLRERFEANMSRHPSLKWAQVEKRLLDNPGALRALAEMEDSEGEPDVVTIAGSVSGAISFIDCSIQTPKGRRSVCYDQAALDSRKAHKPGASAVALADSWGARLLAEEEYFALQQFAAFDTTTSSWLETPPEVRKAGGAIFGDRRFGRVFIYHNGAESYYAARGFRCIVAI